MSEAQIHIARGELELGVLPASEVRELLALGFLLPTDTYEIPDQTDQKPLSELPPITGRKAASIASKVRDTLTSASQVTQKTAVGFATKISSAAGHKKTQMAAASNRMLEDFIPALQTHVGVALAKSSQTVEAALRNEALLRKVFGAVYDLLPKPVRRFVSEETFVEFCVGHRKRLLDKSS